MKVLIDNETFYEISPRWNIDKEKLEISSIEKSDELTMVELETEDFSLTIKERYLDIGGKCQTIAELACKNKADYVEVTEALDNIEKKLVGMVIDAHGTRPGRSRTKRLKH